ncbi:MAG: DUF4917 family protein [Chloroflexota bacterium]
MDIYPGKLKEGIKIHNWSEISPDFIGADLLLGNGFSINLVGHLKYESLFQKFVDNLEFEDQEIFTSFHNNNFELIQETLINALEVNKLFKIKPSDGIIRAIDILRNGLIKSIKSNHPSYSNINQAQLTRIAIQLDEFGDIYTLNYDLFLYHIIMLVKDRCEKDKTKQKYSDYFWKEYEADARFNQFMDSDEYPNKHIHYLHGALFIFEEPIHTVKIIRRGNKNELIDLIDEAIVDGIIPLFISEGKPEKKLEAIRSNDYLTFALREFRDSNNKLIIYGSSLSTQDAHIVNAISRRSNKELAIAIHIDEKNQGQISKDLARFNEIFYKHKISFFDSDTIFKF